MDSDLTKAKVISSLFWKLMERVGTQGIQFVVQIVLARILAPDDYGIVSLIAIFITVANVFVQSGFSTALIQKKHADDADFSSVFYLSLCAATLFYIILFLIAPGIAAFYDIEQLKTILRILAITLFFGAVNSIQNAVIARKMQFKKLFLSSLTATVSSGITGIVLAYAGFGVWALVAQQIVNQVLITVTLWFSVKWRPEFLFYPERVRGLFSYGWKLMVSSLLETLYMNLRSLIVGKIYNAGMLGFYNRGDQFPSIIVSNINGSIQSVMLPTLASQQENRQRVKDMVRRSIVTSSFVLFPMMMGLAVIAEPLVKLLLTDKWLPCVPFLQIFCGVYALWPIHTANLQAINALGRSDIFLKLEIIKKVIGLAILGLTISYGVYAIAFGMLLSSIISTFINAYPNLKFLNYSFIEQLKDIMPSLLLSLVMGIIVYPIKLSGLAAEIILPVQVFAGACLYLGMAMAFKLECNTYLRETLKNMMKSRKGETLCA